MYYDPQKPIAVFLGPSLEKSHASQILMANYYPPARMGDIYQLLGSGVSIIVLIDGMFHNSASIWQRELLDALDNDILLVGAASMGALRAAELHSFGMIGVGTIFEWYRDGVIDGDDEVALHHADETNSFRSFSEPLVNIRYNLMQAVREEIISSEQRAKLIRYTKQLYYADRSLDALLNSPVIKTWPSEVKIRLGRFMGQQPINLKREDTLKALHYAVAAYANQAYAQKRSTLQASKERNRYYRGDIYRQRGFLASSGELVRGEVILAEASKDKRFIGTLRHIVIKHFFLHLLAQQKNISCPVDYLAEYKEQWLYTYVPSDLDFTQWLRANGLTLQEFQALLQQQAHLTWMVEQEPLNFVLDFQSYTLFWRALFALQHQDEDQNAALYWREAKEICYLAAWAKENGVACSLSTVEKFIESWEARQQIADRAKWLRSAQINEETYLAALGQWALAVWLVEKGPRYFGYTSWSFEVALIQELQLTGQAARIVQHITM